ncbi:MAG: hypothetical protein KDB21_01350, partial [Acidimicrobiales bacterium]|nr:hypothetical protein [Acidimicrobiales bacterium]
EELASRWAAILDRPATGDGSELTIRLDQGWIRFVAPLDDRGEGLVGVTFDAGSKFTPFDAVGMRFDAS